MHDREAFVGGLGINVNREMLAAERSEDPFFHSAGDLLQSFGSANGADVFVEKLIGWRQNRFGFTGLGGFCRFSPRLFGRDHRRCHRVRRAAMAGVAGNFAMALEVLLVDGHHHADHLARREFRLLVVFLKSASEVTVFAFDAQRRGDELHRRNDLIGRDSL